jgi:hypothetical protein
MELVRIGSCYDRWPRGFRAEEPRQEQVMDLIHSSLYPDIKGVTAVTDERLNLCD